MNLTELWSGNDYAWIKYKPRVQGYLPGATHVRIIRTLKKQASYENTKLSGYAEVLLIDEEGNPKEDSNGNHIVREVRARDIFMRWEEYVEERALVQIREEKAQKEREERWAQQQREYEERTRKEREEREAREAAERSKKEILTNKLIEKLGINSDVIYSVSSTTVQLTRKGLEEALGIAEGTQ